MPTPQTETRDTVTIRFAGDSGDGMQLTGTQFSNTSALAGNDLATLPDFPAEIRAPAGTLAGVSGFQVQIGSGDIFTPGDQPDVLVAMNPAALQKNLEYMPRGSTLILNKDAFDDRAMAKVGFETDPVTDGSLEAYDVHSIPITSLTFTALEESPLTHRDKERCKNLFALGVTYWIYARELEYTIRWLDAKFGKKPEIFDANVKALKAGYHFGETAEVFQTRYEVPAASIAPGLYRQITGTQALAFGFIAAAELADVALFLGSYPITPASDILHELSKHKSHRVKTFQAEDEIAAVGATIGAAFGGALSITTTSGPGMALKGEALGLAMIAELPLVAINVQRGGPSTGLPTKTEQSDLLQALHGRNGESPCIVIAAKSPSDCFQTAIEASRLATKYMCPVILLTDGYIANGAAPWLIPSKDDFEKFKIRFGGTNGEEGYLPYERDEITLARPWATPGTPELEHRIGGLEKADGTGNVSYDANNHEHMCRTRAEKVQRAVADVPDAEVLGDTSGDLLIVGWGGTYGSLRTTTEALRSEGLSVSHMHLRHMNPLPANVESMLKNFKHVGAAELNLGQLRGILRDRFLVDVQGYNKIQGQPFKVSELIAMAKNILEVSE